MERTAVAATADYVEYKLSELECRVNVQLESKASNKEYNENINKINEIISELSKDNNQAKDSFEYIYNQIKYDKSYFKLFRSTLNNKVSEDKYSNEQKQIVNKLKETCSTDDIKILKSQILPAIEEFRQEAFLTNKQIDAFKQMIMRFDEVILEKASKNSVEKLRNDISELVHKDIFEMYINNHEIIHHGLLDEVSKNRDLTKYHKKSILKDLENSIK